jgi:hypothetical protein
MVLAALCRANLGILAQKTGLMEALVAKHGAEKAKEWYKSTDPFVGASIGKHFRHSMDHIERAALVAATDPYPNDIAELHYDLRVRGGTVEWDMDEAKKWIKQVEGVFRNLSDTTTHPEKLMRRSVNAKFYLSGDESDEFALPSTIARELGFAAHHAIHHLALVKLIATGHAQLDPSDLPEGFGRAPSTLHHDKELKKEKSS